MRATLNYTARFLQTRGWWPLLAELVRYMRAPKYAVQWFVDEDLQAGVLEWHGKHPKRTVRVTPRGWGALARQPMQPWRKRPSDDLRAKIAQKVLDEMLVALKNEQAENRMRALRP